MGVKYPYNTSLVIEWLWSSDCADCLLPAVLNELFNGVFLIYILKKILNKSFNSQRAEFDLQFSN